MSVSESRGGDRTLSLCIPTLDRPRELSRCLASLHAGSMLPDEVLVSDDSPDPGPTRSVCREYERVRYLRGPGAGLATKRNQLIDASTASHVLFTDDDVTFPADCIATAYRLIRGMSPRTVISGFTVNHRPDGRSEKVPPHDPDFWGIQRLPIGAEPRAVSMNAALLPADLFREARFDPRLVYGAEELDLVRHALSVGYRIDYREDLYTDHHPPDEHRDYQTTRMTEGLRLYATAKAYWSYERARAKAVAYAVLAPFQLLGGGWRRGDARGALGAIGVAARLTLGATVRRAAPRRAGAGAGGRSLISRAGDPGPR
jgi:GT2 family glycosyltransferase